MFTGKKLNHFEYTFFSYFVELIYNCCLLYIIIIIYIIRQNLLIADAIVSGYYQNANIC